MKEKFEKIVKDLTNYVQSSGLESLVLGVSGGIDSTVCSAVLYEVAKRTGIKIIGRSLSIKNKAAEIRSAESTGLAFFGSNFMGTNISTEFEVVSAVFNADPEAVLKSSKISRGNIQARLRMIYLYNLAGINTEYYLGFFTLHGDVGDYKPICHLWKTEVYELAEWLRDFFYVGDQDQDRRDALDCAIKITPTDGLGVSGSDLEQIGADSYEDVDVILKTLTNPSSSSDLGDIESKFGKDVVEKVRDRYERSKYKRE